MIPITRAVRAAAKAWTGGCTQLALAAASFVVFVCLTSANYISNDGPVLFFALVVGSAGVGLLALRAGWNPAASPNRLERAVAVGVLGLGVGGFVLLDAAATMPNYQESHDGYVYLLMADSLLKNGSFIVDGDYSHHFPPAYPVYLAGFYAVLGVSVEATKVATAVMHMLALAAVYWTTGRIFGRDRALLTTAIISCVPVLAFFDARNNAEHMVLAVFAMTLYSIWMSLKPATHHYIIYAGLFAGLGYLTKSSLGYFFILAGLAGLVWRLRFGGKATVRDRSYLIAIAVFGSMVVAWAWRNLYRFWDGSSSRFFVDWQSSEYFQEAQEYTFTHEPLTYLLAVVAFIGMGISVLFGYLWPSYPLLRRSWSRINREEESFFWLAVGTTFFISVFISALFWVYEVYFSPRWWNYSPPFAIRYFDFTFLRYACIALLPALWAAFRQAEVEAEPRAPVAPNSSADGPAIPPEAPA